jgi:arginine-tRNA-protein transferase
MILYRSLELDRVGSCPYLSDKTACNACFVASELDAREISALLATGWRKFGVVFFRPACPDCSACTPLRVNVRDFSMSRSQKRVWRKNADLTVRFVSTKYRAEYFELYHRHSKKRFGQEVEIEEFLQLFHTPSCPGLVSEYRLHGRLIGAGYLDLGIDCLSTVYFVFDPDFAGRSPGIFSLLAEIGHARALGLDWYYLGYFVPGCPAMGYKDRLHPREHLDWNTGLWTPPLYGTRPPRPTEEGTT